MINKKLLICTNIRVNPSTPSCAARGSEKILSALSKTSLAIPIEKSPCMGLCDVGPNIKLAPNGGYFHKVSTTDICKLVKQITLFIDC